jgi:oligoribonuclease NrnB/cAMP/cGMP phosphodiesterase (DHH superfamily)
MWINIVYHQIKDGIDCPDAICASWIAARAIGGHGWELIPQVHLKSDDYRFESLPFKSMGNDLYLVDISYPESILNQIKRQANKLVVLDHHKGKEFVAKFGVFDIAECGATLAWKYFHGTGIAGRLAMPWFLPYVRQRDIGADGYYQGEIPESEAIGEAMSARRREYGSGVAAFKFFDELCGIPKSILIQEGLPKIAERNRLIDQYLDDKSLEFMDVAGVSVPYFDLRDRPDLHRHYSMVGARAAIRLPQHPFVALTTDDPKQVSLRSRRYGGADVEIIATSLGGGGYEHAAGFVL